MIKSLEILIILGGLFLFLSLIVTQIAELLSGLFAFRAKFLVKGVQHLLGNSLGKKLIAHPLIQSITFTRIKIPSYIPDYLFTQALINILYKKENSDSSQKNNLKEENLKDLPPQVEAILSSYSYSTEMESRISKWFNEGMERLSGAYKRYIQKITLLVAFILVVLTNADSFQIVQKVWKDSINRSHTTFLAQEQLSSCQVKDEKIICSALPIELTSSVISLWSTQEIKSLDWKGWLFKFFGFALTTLGVALGAPFWFDILTRIAPGLRMAGPAIKKS